METTGQIAQYELIELLGESAEGRTYRVRRGAAGADLVLRRFRSAPDDPPEEAARLRHGLISTARRWIGQAPTGVLRPVDAGELEDGVFVVVPWRPEPTLGRLEGLLLRDPESALYVMRSVGAVLDRLHGAGTVHRSLKASNVLVMDDGDVLLTDVLHLASCSASLMSSDPSAARAIVAAPEQVMGFRQTPASNRYVFATMAYRLVTGAPVFPQQNVVEYLYSTVYRVAPLVSEVRGGLPGAWDRLFAWGLDKEPSARPRTCVEFIDALSEALARERAIDPGGAESAVAAELPWQVAPAAEPARRELRIVEPTAAAASSVESATVESTAVEPGPVEPNAEEGAAPGPVPVSGGRELLASLREAWERPRPLGGRLAGAPLAVPVESDVDASEPTIEDVAPMADAADVIEAAAEAEASAAAGAPDLRLLKSIAARAPTAAPAIGASDRPIRYGREGGERARSRSRRWIEARSGWLSRWSASGAPPRDLEERESYLADWRKGIDPSAAEGSAEPMLPSWPLRVEGCAVGSQLLADGEPVAAVPGVVRLRGKSGTVLQLQVRRDDIVVGRREIRLHPLMDARWDLAAADDGEVRTEA